MRKSKAAGRSAVKKEIGSLVKYLCVGAAATLVEWACFWALSRLGLHYAPATAVAFVLSTFANWALGRRLLFRGKEHGGRAGELLAIYLTAVGGLGFNLLLMYGMLDGLSLDKMAAKVIATGIVFAYNYLMRRFWVYREPRSGAARRGVWKLIPALLRFSATDYLRLYPDVRASRMNPYWHFLRYGYWEGRASAKLRIAEDDSVAAFLARKSRRRPAPTAGVSLVRLSAAGQTANENGIAVFSRAVGGRLEKLLAWFADESVMAVVEVDAALKKPLVLSAYELATCLDGMYAATVAPQRCLLRVAGGFSVPEEVWDDEGLFANMLLRHTAAGSVVLVPVKGRAKEKKEPSARAFVERLAIGMELYGATAEQAAKQLEAYRLSHGMEASDALLSLAEHAGGSAVSKRRILISILGFSFGGGEIMPIRLANALHRAGWPVLVHIAEAGLTDGRVRSMLRADVPVVATNQAGELGALVTEYGIDVVHTHHQGTQSLCAQMMKQTERRVRHIATTHGMYESLDEETLSFVLTQQLCGCVDEWTYVADKNLPPILESGLWPAEAFHKIPNGMDPPEIHPLRRADYGIPENAFVFCLASRALPQKGWLKAAEAIAAARRRSGLELHLLLVGQGEAYDRMMEAPPEPFIHLVGYQSSPCDWYAISDAGLLPSWYVSESTPLTLIESLQCGKPFLASDVGEIAKMLQIHGQMAGMVVPLENGGIDTDTLAERMIEMASDTERYQTMCRLAREKAPDYALDEVARRYAEVYDLDQEAAENQLCRFRGLYRRTRQLLRRGRRGENCPHVTVIVPNYNHKAYLRERLESVYRQTYRNFDVLLLDDGSSDGSTDILRDYAARYPERTTLLLNSKNSGGVFHQWRRGILAAAGDLCWIAESDDWCELTFLEKLTPLFADQSVRLASAHYVFAEADGTLQRWSFERYLSVFADETQWESPFVREAAELVRSALGVGNCLPNASGIVFRRPEHMALLDDPSWVSMKICGDWLFYLHLAYGGLVGYTDLTDSFFRLSADSAGSSAYQTPAYYREHETVAKTVARLYPVTEEVLQRAAKYVRAFADVHNGTELCASEYRLKRVLAAREGALDAPLPELPRFRAPKTLFASLLQTVTEDAESAPAAAIEKLGMNTGNMLFTNALRQQMAAAASTECPFSEERFAPDIRSGGIPAANQIINGCPDCVSDMIRLYEKTDFPLTMIGLGAQADLKTTPEQLAQTLNAEQRKLFALASERAVTIGVRGRFSGRCLEALGIYNYRVVGCPSAFLRSDDARLPLRTPTVEKPLIGVTRNQALERTPAMQSKIIRLGMEHNAEWVMQMLTELPPCVLRGEAPTLGEIQALYPEENWEDTGVCQYVAEHTHIFFRQEQWHRYLKQGGFTFAFGSRFHGIVAALQAGIPGLLLAHDARTLELAQTLHLPYVTPEQFARVTSMEELLAFCDYTAYYENYEAMERNYTRCLEENGLAPHFFGREA